ncbi:MAG: RNA polymerase sigma factor [Actinobacteria bacterium]|nr:RNA polymerase sigma factor [Actinomycetota bacterium]MDQ3532364.1 RNA polymerase sigma factor [Actinomycetota bacterium]
MSSLPPFWLLVEQHGDELMRYARRLSGDDAEDVLQEALLKALRSYPKLGDGNHLRAWLYRVTTTAAWDHSARRRRRPEVLTDSLPVTTTDPHENDDDFGSLIGQLSPGARAALTLRYVEDLSYESIGTRLGCSPEAARQRVSTAVRSLRKRLT